MTTVLLRVFALQFAILIGGPVHVAAQSMPVIEMTNLAGQDVRWPEDLPGDPAVVIIAYKREQQSDVESWVTELGFGSDGPYAQVLILGRGAALARGFIDGGLRSAFDAAAQARTFTLYVAPNTLNGPLGITSTDDVTVLVVARNGQILTRQIGAPTAAGLAAVRSAL